jgi:hypothetical protein
LNATVSINGYTLDWLKCTLKNIPTETPVLLFSHFPLHPDTPKYPVRNTEQLFSLLDARNVVACFSGHYHSLWRGERNGVSFFTNACMSLTQDNHDGTDEEGYLLATVYESGVEVQFCLRGASPL